MSSSKPKASGSKKGGTQSKRNHSFQSFTQKIANLKIDPVRRVRRHVDNEETEKSFFHSSLESWVDLNLSATFTEFSREAIPLSESLPHILHYKDVIFELLVKYIDRRDVLALEPLLSLLSQFAHDLGATFEPYFARSVKLLSCLVAKHADVSTIEWTFNCLAYLLKYLSRLLVPDLRPLFEILAPLLGREQQKAFITRFAAEALSFLLRKAREEPLRLIVRHAFEDLIKCDGHPGAKGYRQGLMNMFQEACISVDRTIHSKGPQILRTMLDISLDLSDTSGPCFSVCQGVLISLMHHTTSETFQPALTSIYEFFAELLNADSVTPQRVRMAARLLYTVVTVRKGSRIMDWQKVAIAAVYILEVGTSLVVEEQAEELNGAVWEGLKAATIILQQADLEIVISRCAKVVDKAREFQNGALFLPFCDFFSAMGPERFKVFILPYFQRFILSQWSSNSSALCLLIPKLCIAGSLTPSKEHEVPLDILGPKSPLTVAAQTAIRDFDAAIESLAVLDRKSSGVIIASGYLDALLSLPLPITADLIESLEGLLQKVLPMEGSITFAPLIGKALSLYSRGMGSKAKSLVEITCKAFPRLGDNTSFLQGVANFALISSFKELIGEGYIEEVVTKLVTNLLAPSHEVRTSSLRCLEILYAYKNPTSQVSEIINTAKLIEDTPLTMNNARTISMYIRRLGIEYSSVSKDSWERRIVPCYCFGLLTIHFAPAWDDSALALAKIAQIEEELVAELAFSWLSMRNEGEDTKPEAPAAPNPWTSYECSNMRVVDEDSNRCLAENMDASTILASEFEKELRVVPLSAVMARTQALKVLCEIPQIAEKRSRRLVPMFLEWTRMDDEDAAEEEIQWERVSMKWSRKDRVAMLQLFAKFINPRTLFKSELVYSALLNLLASGDITSQTLALKCVYTWKIPAIRTYEDNLNNLLDDTHFREEVTKFVQVEEEESIIQTDHRKELMPVLLRILYGRSLSRKNASSGKKGMVSKRTVVLASLANFQPHEREIYIDIALGELAEAKFVDKSNPERYALRPGAIGSVHVSTRKQVGFVRMVEDMLKQLGSTMLDYVPKIMDALLYCLVSAAKNVGEVAVEQSTYEGSVSLKVSKAIRQGGFKSLIALFTNCPNFGWAPYMPVLFEELVEPRLESLPIETSQGLSGLLQLLFTWTKARSTVLFLSDYNDQVLPKIAQCLASKQVKDEVVLFILNLMRNIVSFVKPEEDMEVEDNSQAVRDRLIRPNVDLFIVNTGEILHKSPGKEVLEQAVETIAEIAPYVSGDTETTHLVDVLVFMLDQPTRRVSPKAKSEILKILVHFLPLCVMEKGDDLFERTFRSVSSLFGFFKDREGRENLARVLNVFAKRDDEMIEVAKLSQQLNSWSNKRLDEPDFDQRLEAYAKINEERYKIFTPRQWMPLLFNMLFFIKDNEELVIRTNAAYSLRRFAESVGAKLGTSGEEAYLTTLSGTVLPALRTGTREKSELVRSEFVGVMAHVVKECNSWEDVSDMKPLLFGKDEEASFFNNILHIQQHRRLRALRRLATAAEKENIQSSNIAHFFLPLIEHFIFDMAEDGHNLASETVITVGALVQQLSWSQYRAVFRRYTGYLRTRVELEKIVVRLIGVVVESLSKSWETAPTNPNKSEAVAATTTTDGDGDAPMEAIHASQLAESLPEQDILAKDISNGFLPTLDDYLHKKDESTVSLRVPIAVSIVKLLKVMPEEMLKLRLPAVLTDVSHILRSRAQDSRDMTRRTLTEITTLLGPQYLGFVIKELRGALLRGYQLHVLSYTVHSILVSVAPSYAPGDLDYCVSQIVDVVMDDIFGVTGMEKDAEGYISKMKEVKGSKSYDSMDLLASTTTLPNLGKLIKPIQSLLQEKMDLKMAKKIDELLRRIGVGLLRNEAVKSQELLVFCYQVVQEAHKASAAAPVEKKVDSTTLRYIVNLKAPSKAASGVTTSSHAYKLIRFSLDILRTVLHKYEDLKTPEFLAGFIPIIGDALLSQQEEVQVSALRLLTTIIRVPLPSIDDGAPVFVQQALSFVKNSPSTNSEIAQASLKLLAAILRERRSFRVKETTIAYLLTRIKPDLEEPDRQGITFNFLKAVLSRKIVITEVYEVLDNVAAIMVTNQTRTVRDLARGVYFQFLMEYPQGKERLNKQLAFLLKNLDYVHQSGRQSVLEAANLLITKIGDTLIQDVLATFFVPLVMVLINDDSTECREMAGAIIKKIFERADKERLQVFVSLIRGWLEQDEKKLLVRVALQVYGLYFEVYEIKGQKEVAFVTERLQVFLKAACDEESKTTTEWELVYFGLQTWAKIVEYFPETSFSGSNDAIWGTIRDCLVFPHAWVKLSAARLMGLLLAEYSKSSVSLSNLPLENGRGLSMDGIEMVKIARATSSQLNNAELSDELGLQVVKNLLFMGRCFYANKMAAIDSVPQNDQELDDVEEDRELNTALLWIIGRISGVVRSERNVKKGQILGKKFGLQWMAAMTQIIAGEDLIPLSIKVIVPLYNLVDSPENYIMKDLKDTAQEILSMIQTKMGPTAYGKAYNAVRTQVQERRRERKLKRTIQMVTDPEKATKEKIRKNEKKRVARKEKSAVHREQRKGRLG